MQKGFATIYELFIFYQEFPKAVEPRMGHFDNPAAALPRSATTTFLPADPWPISARGDNFLSWLAVIPLVGVKIVFALRRLNKDHGIEDRGQLRNVMPVCACHDQRQRDAKSVHQQVPFASVFFPGPSGSARQPPAPAGP